jgi:peptide/nickel transport system substrate-binding protein
VPYLDAMDWVVFDNDGARVAAFEDEQVQVMANRDRIEAESLSGEITVDSHPSLAWVSLGLRVDARPLDDPRVRRAIDLSLDRAALIRDFTLDDGDVLGPVNPHLADGYWSLSRGEVLASHDGRTPLEDRRAAARALLDAAGEAPLALTLQLPSEPPLLGIGNAVAAQLREAGIAVTLETLDQLAWYTNFIAGKFQATLISNPPYETADVPSRLYHSGGPHGTGSMFGFADDAIDGLVERSWSEVERDVRRDTLREAQRLMLEARPVLPLFTGVGFTSAWRYVRNRQPELQGSMAQYHAEHWLDRPS